jgi:hypothetical protein
MLLASADGATYQIGLVIGFGAMVTWVANPNVNAAHAIVRAVRGDQPDSLPAPRAAAIASTTTIDVV